MIARCSDLLKALGVRKLADDSAGWVPLQPRERQCCSVYALTYLNAQDASALSAGCDTTQALRAAWPAAALNLRGPRAQRRVTACAARARIEGKRTLAEPRASGDSVQKLCTRASVVAASKVRGALCLPRSICRPNIAKDARIYQQNVQSLCCCQRLLVWPCSARASLRAARAASCLPAWARRELLAFRGRSKGRSHVRWRLLRRGDAASGVRRELGSARVERAQPPRWSRKQQGSPSR